MKARNKIIIITGIIIFAIGLLLFLIGAIISGWDIIAFLKSQTFIFIIILLCVYVLFVIIIFVKDWYNKL